MNAFKFTKTQLLKYKIIYPRYNMSYLVTRELQKLVKKISKITGKETLMLPDNKREFNYEIVVDNANRCGSPEINDYDTYVIAPVGNKIFIKGGRPYSTVAGVKRFIKLLEKGEPITQTITGSYDADKSRFGKDYRLAWNDDFDSKEIDESKWQIYYEKKLCYCEGLNGKQTMRCRKEPPNTFQKDGDLYICATETEDAYYGGMLCTHDTMRYKYGFIEISAIHPKGAGFWTALWLNGNKGKNGDYYAEIDVDECYGKGGDYVLGNTFAWPSKKCKEEKDGQLVHYCNRKNADERGFWQDYHTFGFEWDEKRMTFTCDGFPYKTQDITKTDAEKEAFQVPFFLRLSMALGFSARKEISTDPWEWENTNKLIVDYVNIYQKPDQEIFINEIFGWDAFE